MTRSLISQNSVLLWICCSVVLTTSAVTLAAEKPPFQSGLRVALLVGNRDYDGVKLPQVDASLNAVESTLQDMGFTIDRRTNLDQKAIQLAFDETHGNAPTNSVLVIYYIGLSGCVRRNNQFENLLRPVGVKIENENDYRSSGLNLNKTLQPKSTETGARTTLVFFDCCWQSPIAPNSDNFKSGLASFKHPTDMAVIFNAESGETKPLNNVASATEFSKSVAKHLNGLETSIDDTLTQIASDTGDAWRGGCPAGGIGAKPNEMVAALVDDGKKPGDAWVNSIGMSFRWCPPGKFQMGSREIDTPATRDRQATEVELTQGFWIGAYETTQREYQRVMGRTVAASFTQHRNAPYWGVSDSKNIADFCKKLTDLDRKAKKLPTNWEYACPTEAQWEYACRAETTSAYCFGNDASRLGEFGNAADLTLLKTDPDCFWASPDFDDGIGASLAIVGSYRPNQWGIHDMHGNVAELVADHWLPQLPGGSDPFVQVEKEAVAVLRGGAWCSTAPYCESSFRNRLTTRDKSNYVGFRIVLKQTN